MMWANTPIYSVPYSRHQVTWGNAVLRTGKEQFLEKHFNGHALQALVGSNISAASLLTVLSVQPGETCRGKSKGKMRALSASFYTTCAGQLEQYGGLLSPAKSKEPPIQRQTPSQQKFLPGYHTVPRDSCMKIWARSLGTWRKMYLDFFLLQAFCKEAIRENLANEMRVKTVMKWTPFPTLPSGETAIRRAWSEEEKGFVLFLCLTLRLAWGFL